MDTWYGYKLPELLRIGHAPRTALLFSLESKRTQPIMRCAREWQEAAGRPGSDFWTIALPQQLLDTLATFDHRAAYLAALAYVRYHQTAFAAPVPAQWQP